MRIRTKFIVCFLFVISATVFAQIPTLAVLDFENNSFFKPEEYQSLSKGLAEIMVTELSRSSSIRVVERRKLRSIMDELKLSQSGAISGESSIQVGKLLGAQHLVFGGYMVMMDQKIRIDIRIVEVETGLTLKAGEATGKTKEVLTLIQKLGDKIYKDLNIKLTEKQSASADKINTDALMLFSKGVEYEDDGDSKKAAECYRKALDLQPDFPQAILRMAQLSGK